MVDGRASGETGQSVVAPPVVDGLGRQLNDQCGAVRAEAGDDRVLIGDQDRDDRARRRVEVNRHEPEVGSGAPDTDALGNTLRPRGDAG